VTRRITATLAIALETQGTGTPQEFAEALAGEIEFWLPSVCIVMEGVPVAEHPAATVTRVAVSRATEQEAS
jgi:hypothetical protein